ncbi:MAG: ribonuclease catalytic domain-containing protein [Thermodesulfobacteriota bacterium]
MKAGEIVIFRKRKEPSFGVFLSSLPASGETAGAEQMTVFSEEGREISVAADKAAFFTGIFLEGGQGRELANHLRRLRKEMEAERVKIDLRPAWEKLRGAGAVSFEEIVSAFFPETPEPHDKLKLFWAVDKDAVYFRREKDGYTPLSPECVEKTIDRAKRRSENARQDEMAERWIRSVMDGKPEEPEGFDRRRCVKTVMDYIENTEDSAGFRDARRLLSKAGIRDSAYATGFLIKTGDLPEGTDPAMVRAGITDGFPPEAAAECAGVIAAPLPDFLEDFTGLAAFSVDDETTRDIDDAISVEKSPAGWRVGAHIANVATAISPDSALDRAALSAGETLYLPERVVDIFPPELISGRLSLTAGKERAALTLFMDFDENLEMTGFSFHASKIRVEKNITYPEADEMIESLPEWKTLERICEHLKKRRDENGAFSPRLAELKIKAAPDGSVEVFPAPEGGVSHSVIAELMIAVNRLSAIFLRDRGVAALFRSQPFPVSPEARELDTKDPLFHMRVVRMLKPSRTGAAAQRHCSLGVECYAQATSPIRRYRDLVVQRQVMAELTGSAALGETAILQVVADTEPVLHARRAARRSRDRFWLCEHFKRLGKDARFEGIVSRAEDGRVFVYLPDYFAEFPLRGADGTDFKVGQKVTVAVKDADGLKRRVKLKVV